jgi:hypothetical protein
MSRFLIPVFLLGASRLVSTAQNALPTVGYGYTLPTPIFAAPGQLVTLIVEGPNDGTAGPFAFAPGGADLPLSLGGISATYAQLISVPPSIPYTTESTSAPILQVDTFYTALAADSGDSGTKLLMVTLQIPFEALACSVPGCAPAGQPDPSRRTWWSTAPPAAYLEPAPGSM